MAQQQPPGVPVGRHRVRAGVALAGGPAGEERLPGRGRALTSAPQPGLAALGGQDQQLGDRREIPVGIGRVAVAEQGGQHRQPGLHVHAVPVPGQQRVHRQRVAEAVQAGPACLRAGLQAGLADQPGEDVVDVLADQPGPGSGHQQARRPGVGKALIAELPILGEGVERARVQRDLPALRELAVPDRHDPLGGVQVGPVQPDCLTEPHAGRAQKADQGLVRGGVQGRAQRGRGGHQGADFCLAVQVGHGPAVAAGQQAHRGDLGGRIERLQVAGEAADHPQPGRVPGRQGVFGQGGPGQGQPGSDGDGAGCLHEGGKIVQQPAVVFQLVSQRPAHGQVVVDGLADAGHAAPPGHGRARPRSAARSTFA